jgi:Uri superfamily endonuclease
MDKGIYCLVFRNPACTVLVGTLGEIAFRHGWHIYVGSALGSGGLARMERHIDLAQKNDRHPKWHVDYLLTSDHFHLRYAVAAATTKPLECDLARAIGGRSIPGFGCSDCDCTSHLFFREKQPVKEVEEAFRSLELAACTKTLMNR